MADTAILIPINLSANTFATLYTVPENKRAVLNINFCNTSTSDTSFFLSFVPQGGNETAPVYFIENNQVLKGATGNSESTKLRTGEILPAGTMVVAKSTLTGTCITITGVLGN